MWSIILFEKYEILSSRINRQYLRFIGILVPLVTIISSVIIYAFNDSSFSFLTHYLSHLGGAPKGAGIIFNIGIMISGLIMILFFLNLSAYLRRKNTNTLLIYLAFISGLISSLGTFFLGVFPYTVTQELRNFSASFFFMGGFSYCILYGISEWTTQGISKLQATSGFIAAAFFIIFIFFTSINFFNYYLFIDEAHLTEWILFFVVMIWVVEHEVSMTRDKIKISKES